MPPLLTKHELAAFLNVTPKTIDLYRKLGLIRGYKFRGQLRFATGQVLDFLRAHQE